MENGLIFEPSWEKAIAEQDRESIKQLHKESPLHKGKLSWLPIRAAMNHHGALLAMVLIQNGTDAMFRVEGIALTYSEQGRGTIAKSVFSLPQVKVPPYSSMPWTFVFAKGSIEKRPLLKDWSVKLFNDSNY